MAIDLNKYKLPSATPTVSGGLDLSKYKLEATPTQTQPKQKSLLDNMFVSLAPFKKITDVGVPLAKGFGKGVLQFGSGLGISPAQTGGVATAGIAKKENLKAQQSIKNFQDVADRILEAAQQTEDPNKREELFGLANEAYQRLDDVKGFVSDTTQRLSSLADKEIAPELQPQGTAETVGFFGEKIGEFLLPTKYINKANTILSTGIDVAGITKASPLLSSAFKILGKAGIEAGTTYGISKFQGASDEEASKNAKLAGAISGGLGVAGKLLNATGGKFYELAQRTYRSALKPSTAGKMGAERATENVLTGLQERIVLSQRGVQKTAEVIDDLESQLDDAIKVAAGKGSGEFVFTPDLKPYIDEVKDVVANTLDIKGSQVASQQIDDLWTNLVAKYGTKIPIEEAQALKVNTYRVLKDSYDQLASPVREGLKQLTRGVKEGILEAAPKTGEINPRLAKLYKFDEALNKANARVQNLNLLGLGTKVLAATGGKLGGILAITDALLGSPAAKSRIGITLYRFGDLLKRISPEQIGQVSASPAVKSFLQRVFGAQGELTDDELRYAKNIKDFLESPESKRGAINFDAKIGSKTEPLTTKFLSYIDEKLAKNPNAELSRQEILDFARRPELKKGEADLLNAKIKEFTGDKLPAQDFADSIRRDLLELKPVKVSQPQYSGVQIDNTRTRPFGEPDPAYYKKAGKNYEEVVFESPITTNGSSHYPNSKNYFAHARGDEVVEGGKKIWREQEIQSDLLQKEGLEAARGTYKGTDEAGNIAITKNKAAREAEIARLDPFTNDRFGERIMRERIREKAQKGYSKYRLPTGETIGKIEGFASPAWTFADRTMSLTPNRLKVGMEVNQGAGLDSWIITDILGDGRFKAVPKDFGLRSSDAKTWAGENWREKYTVAGEYVYPNSRAETFDLKGKSNPQYRRYEQWGKFLKNKYGGKLVTDPQGNSWVEIDLKKEQGKMPVEAFGVAPILLGEEND